MHWKSLLNWRTTCWTSGSRLTIEILPKGGLDYYTCHSGELIALQCMFAPPGRLALLAPSYTLRTVFWVMARSWGRRIEKEYLDGQQKVDVLISTNCRYTTADADFELKGFRGGMEQVGGLLKCSQRLDRITLSFNHISKIFPYSIILVTFEDCSTQSV